MRTSIVLAMHGAPPRDLPKRKLGEFFRLHMQLEWGIVSEEKRPALERRCARLEEEIYSSTSIR